MRSRSARRRARAVSSIAAVVAALLAAVGCTPPPSDDPLCPDLVGGTWTGTWRESSTLVTGWVSADLQVDGREVTGTLGVGGPITTSSGPVTGSVSGCNEVHLERDDGAVAFQGVLALGGRSLDGEFTTGGPLGQFTGLMQLSTATAAGVADLDRDGVVDCADIQVLLDSWGPVPWGHAADLNLDGEVDVYDLSLLLSAYDGPDCPGLT